MAKKAFDAYFIISAPLRFVEKKIEPFFINGSYKDSNFLVILLLLEPIIILSGNLKSLIASPSRKNSGLEATSNNFLFFLFEIIFSILSRVVTGTVDFTTIILNLLIFQLIYFATSKTELKSADLFFFEVGVPTQINTISESLTALCKSFVNLNLLDK